VIEEVSRLPSPVREVIEILYFRDAGYEEAESLTGLSERTLRRHRDRGIRLLRKRLVAAR
jgi:DNA-directed RNA polymerase specialized sigma24 family protein